jgi:hypothetical protein
MRRLAAITLFLILFAAATRSIAQQSFGSADVKVQNQTTPNSLLAGKTPATFTSLAGWTTVAKGDFSGSGTDCFATGGCYCGGSCKVSVNAPHGATAHANETDVAGDQFDSRIGVVTGVATEYYASGYRLEAGAPTMGDDHMYAHVYTHFPNGAFEECYMDPQDNFIDYITTTAPAEFGCQGRDVFTAYNEAPSLTIQTGVYVQYEYWFRPSSCTGSTMNTDGFQRFYVNGVLLTQIDSTHMTDPGRVPGRMGGCPSMNTSSSMNIEFGGIFSFLSRSSGSLPSSPCGPQNAPAPYNFAEPRCGPFSACPALQVNGHTCWGSQPTFKVFQTDVIFLKR